MTQLMLTQNSYPRVPGETCSWNEAYVTPDYDHMPDIEIAKAGLWGDRFRIGRVDLETAWELAKVEQPYREVGLAHEAAIERDRRARATGHGVLYSLNPGGQIDADSYAVGPFLSEVERQQHALAAFGAYYEGHRATDGVWIAMSSRALRNAWLN